MAAQMARSIVVCGLALLLAGCDLQMWAPGSVPRADPQRMEEMLDAGAYRQIDAEIERLRSAYAAGKTSEAVFMAAFHPYQRIDVDLLEKLDTWIEALPDSYAALLSRGLYFERFGDMAWLQENRRFYSDTQLAKMHFFFQRAEADAAAAVALRPDIGAAHALAMRMAASRKDWRRVAKIKTTALALDPRSFEVRLSYIDTVLPFWVQGRYRSRPADWAGTLAEIEEDLAPLVAFMAELRKDADTYPDLKPLLGYMDYVHALENANPFRGKTGLEHLQRATAYGTLDRYILTQAAILVYLERYDEGIAVLADYVPSREFASDFAYARARIMLVSRKPVAETFAALDQALASDPYHPNFLLFKARIHLSVRDFAGALLSLDKALVFGADNKYVRYERGRILFQDLSDAAGAVPDLRRAAELSPTSEVYQYRLAEALYQTEPCEARAPLQKYLDIQAARDMNDANTYPQTYLWAKGAYDLLIQSQLCTQ